MAGHRLQNVLLLTLALSASGIAACSYGDTPAIATVGEKMALHCGLLCFSGVYEWYLINGTQNTTLPETNRSLTVSENVLTVEEVGGRVYECRCNNRCTKFKIGVKPVVHLHVSQSVAKSGSNVTVTCTAESYPAADNANNFELKHPLNTQITQDPLSDMNGVFHIIKSVDRERDSGEYECTVSVTLPEYPDQHLQSNAKINLIVYDPPTIVGIRNFTIFLAPNLEQSAVLECKIQHKESDVNVWVNWTSSDGEKLKNKYSVVQDADVFFFVLYNVTQDNVHKYTCQLFSTYSAEVPEDQKTAEIASAGSKGETEGVTPKKEDCNYLVVGIVPAAAVIALAAVLVVIAFAIRCVHKQRKKQGNEDSLELHRRSKGDGTSEEASDGTTGNGAAPDDTPRSNEQGAVESDGASSSELNRSLSATSHRDPDGNGTSSPVDIDVGSQLQEDGLESSMEEEVHSKSPIENITVGQVKFRERLSSRLSLTRRPSNLPGDDEEGLLPKNHNNY